MIRLGPDNEREMKIRLHRIRALLLGQAAVLPHKAAPPASPTVPASAHS
jgi:hypothetical protein